MCSEGTGEYAQIHQSLRCLQNQRMDVDENPD